MKESGLDSIPGGGAEIFHPEIREQIAKDKILRKFQYAHPVFSLASFAAQQRRAEICGRQHTHFTGAYWYNGFHEDGVRSALDVCKRFDCEL